MLVISSDSEFDSAHSAKDAGNEFSLRFPHNLHVPKSSPLIPRAQHLVIDLDAAGVPVFKGATSSIVSYRQSLNIYPEASTLAIGSGMHTTVYLNTIDALQDACLNSDKRSIKIAAEKILLLIHEQDEIRETNPNLTIRYIPGFIYQKRKIITLRMENYLANYDPKKNYDPKLDHGRALKNMLKMHLAAYRLATREIEFRNEFLRKGEEKWEVLFEANNKSDFKVAQMLGLAHLIRPIKIDTIDGASKFLHEKLEPFFESSFWRAPKGTRYISADQVKKLLINSIDSREELVERLKKLHQLMTAKNDTGTKEGMFLVLDRFGNLNQQSEVGDDIQDLLTKRLNEAIIEFTCMKPERFKPETAFYFVNEYVNYIKSFSFQNYKNIDPDNLNHICIIPIALILRDSADILSPAQKNPEIYDGGGTPKRPIRSGKMNLEQLVWDENGNLLLKPSFLADKDADKMVSDITKTVVSEFDRALTGGYALYASVFWPEKPIFQERRPAGRAKDLTSPERSMLLEIGNLEDEIRLIVRFNRYNINACKNITSSFDSLKRFEDKQLVDLFSEVIRCQNRGVNIISTTGKDSESGKIPPYYLLDVDGYPYGHFQYRATVPGARLDLENRSKMNYEEILGFAEPLGRALAVNYCAARVPLGNELVIPDRKKGEKPKTITTFGTAEAFFLSQNSDSLLKFRSNISPAYGAIVAEWLCCIDLLAESDIQGKKLTQNQIHNLKKRFIAQLKKGFSSKMNEVSQVWDIESPKILKDIEETFNSYGIKKSQSGKFPEVLDLTKGFRLTSALLKSSGSDIDIDLILRCAKDILPLFKIVAKAPKPKIDAAITAIKKEEEIEKREEIYRVLANTLAGHAMEETSFKEIKSILENFDFSNYSLIDRYHLISLLNVSSGIYNVVGERKRKGLFRGEIHSAHEILRDFIEISSSSQNFTDTIMKSDHTIKTTGLSETAAAAYYDAIQHLYSNKWGFTDFDKHMNNVEIMLRQRNIRRN